jgi:hypothetical protein
MTEAPPLIAAPLPEQYGEFATCPITGLQIPKTLAGNIAWRRKLIDAAKTSATWRRRLKQASASSPVFWLNAFGWTFLQKRINVAGKETAVIGDRAAHVPFVTWKVQDESLLTLRAAIEGGHDALISKARDMGASWLCVAIIQWFWQFRPATTFLELSRKEVLVDRPGDMDSLFEKHRYLLKWQPEWLRPQRVKDNRLHLENQDIGTAIMGESTNRDAGQASRKTAILLDEFARVADGDEIDLSTADTTACRIFNSTPGGPNTQFTRIYRTMKAGTRSGVIVELPWWRHPDKGRGAEQVLDTESGRLKWTSPWYKDQVARRSKRNVAQNLDMEHGRVGDMIFDPDDVERHRAKFQREPVAEGNVTFDEALTEDAKKAIVRRFDPLAMRFVQGSARRPWRLWIPLLDWTAPKGAGKLPRPPQNTRYVFGVDTSTGSGASNSVVTVLDHKTGAIVAKWWDAYTSPEELAEVVVFAAVWFGGVKPPLVVFEKNGPGGILGRKLLKMGYPALYFQKNESIKHDPKTPRWGWHSSPARKEMLLGEYREALKTEEVVNPCREALDEALEYVYDDKGKIEPGLKAGDDEGSGSALHGDHVIADALVVLGRRDLPKEIPQPEPRGPEGTFAARREAFKRRSRSGKEWSG